MSPMIIINLEKTLPGPPPCGVGSYDCIGVVSSTINSLPKELSYKGNGSTPIISIMWC